VLAIACRRRSDAGTVPMMMRSTILIALFALLVAPVGRVHASSPHLQLCWAAGAFDQTVYFAQAEVDDDRKESFDALLSISGIDHTEMQCVTLLSEGQHLEELKRQWSEQKLEVINTTFLSKLDY
jgi:hypothetical protein